MYKLFYNKKDISADISSEVFSISYRDFLQGQADELSISITDQTHKWLKSFYPNQGANLSLELKNRNNYINLGDFFIKEISYSTPPFVLTMTADSVGMEKKARTKKAKSFVDTDLATVVAFIAKRLGLSLSGKIEKIKIKNLIQYQERDLEFLNRLAIQYDYTFKVFKNKLIFTKNKNQKSEPAVLTLNPNNIISFEMRDYIKDTPKVVVLENYEIDDRLKTTVKAETSTENNGEEVKSSAPSTMEFDAMQAQADASVFSAESDTKGGNITLIGSPIIVAGQNIELVDFGNFNGIYFINSTTHQIENAGYTTSLEVKFIK